MAQMTGADIGDLESGAARLESVGGQIGAMRRPLRSQLYSSYWEGRAAERFRSQWDTVHGPALSNAEDFLRNAGRVLREEAEQQRRASAAGSARSRSRGHGVGNDVGTSARSDFFEWANLDEFRTILNLYGLVNGGWDLLRLARSTGSLALSPLGAFLGPLEMGFGLIDLFLVDDGYGGGQFKNVERAADVLGVAGGYLSMVGGTLALAAPIAGPAAPVLLAVGTGIAVIGFGVSVASSLTDYAMERWVSGGREDWNATVDAVSDGFRSTASSIDRVWDKAYDSGSEFVADAWDNVHETASDAFETVKGWFG